MPDRNKRALPIGNVNFKQIIADDIYYVDKTEMIRDIIDYKVPVSLFTRPRRFGKTLNMDMLRTFFEKTEQDNSIYFKNLKIWQYGEKYTTEQGKYPVIYLSLKEIKDNDWDETFKHLKDEIATEFLRHKPLQFLNVDDEIKFNRITNKTADLSEFSDSLKFLSRVLAENFNSQVIIIIDEYDTPIQSGYINNFFKEVMSFMRNFFSGGFKDNLNLKFGFMTGILRVAKENIFSGLNNLRVYSILDNAFSQYFGFTELEVDEMVEYYGYTEKMPEIKEWYDGYIFGKSEIYNPWSVINCIDLDCQLTAHWVNTSSNDLIRKLISSANSDTIQNLQKLYDGKSIVMEIDTSVTYPELKNSINAVFSFLTISGYLKARCKISDDGEMKCQITIPNKEIRTVYKREIIGNITDKYGESIGLQIGDALFAEDIEAFGRLLKRYMLQSMSFFDSSEGFYHGLILGICAIMTGNYKVKSNRESGLGRFDIALFPIKKNIPGYIFELKLAKENDDLDNLAKIGLEQIEQKEYIAEFAEQKITEIQKIGIAFRGKETALFQV